jgi:hypothetical protein
MAEPKRKLVKVDDSIIAFPDAMPDEHVATVIKSFRAKKTPQPLATEESEHARQLKPAQPLETAIPSLPKWANTPLSPILDKKVDYVDRALWPGGTANWDKGTAAAEADKQKFMTNHPIGGGIFEGVSETAEGLTTPANLALMILAPESKIMSGLFAIQSLHGSYKDVEEARKAYREGRNAEASKYATQAILNLGIAGLAGHHAVKDIPVPEGVKDFVKSEEGSVGPQETVPPKEDNTLKMLTDGKQGGYTLDYWLKNHPDVKILSVGKESIDPSTLHRLQGWTRESKLDEWKTSNANVKDMPPVEVVRTPHGDYLYDGTHRAEFATRQGEKVPANVYTIRNRNDATPAPKLSDVKAKAAELKPTTAYKSVDQSQPFYLKSENLVSEKMKGPMPAEDVHKMLLSKPLGVKPEEMKWTRLEEFLQGKGKQKITPQEIQEHLAGNNLQVQEVMHGAPSKSAQYDEEIRKLSHWPEDVKTAKNPSDQPRLNELLRLWDEAETYAAPPKFGSYALPGAEPGSYRELLVTMPEKAAKVDLKKAADKAYEDKEWFQADIRRRTGRFLWEALTPEEKAEYQRLSDAYQSARDAYTSGGNENFRSSHWDEPNVLGHVRFNDRTGPNGEKILHLEELQSDMHQQARTKGYRLPPRETAPMDSEYRALVHKNADARARGEEPKPADVARAKELEDALIKADKSKIPDMPFKKNWHELLLKRMMKYAADNGYDGVSWTPGEHQAERYDLSKQVDRITYSDDRVLKVYDKDGDLIHNRQVAEKDLPDFIGKEAAQKLVDQTPHQRTGNKQLEGLDLKVGGEGMKGFYDKIVPDAVNKIAKQWGAKVGETEISVPSLDTHPRLRFAVQDESGAIYSQANTRDEIDRWLATRQREFPRTNFQIIDQGEPQAPSNKTTVPYLPITPQMRAGVKSIPYSLFSIPLAAGALTLQQVKAQGDELQKKFKPTGVTK